MLVLVILVVEQFVAVGGGSAVRSPPEVEPMSRLGHEEGTHQPVLYEEGKCTIPPRYLIFISPVFCLSPMQILAAAAEQVREQVLCQGQRPRRRHHERGRQHHRVPPVCEESNHIIVLR